MVKKFFFISMFLGLFLIAFNTNYIIVRGNDVEFQDELEYEANSLFDKGIMICREISDVGNLRIINSINNWYSNLSGFKLTTSQSDYGHGGEFTGGKVSTMDMFTESDSSIMTEAWGYVIYYGSFLLLPLDLTLNLLKLSFNCFNILIGGQVQIRGR